MRTPPRLTYHRYGSSGPRVVLVMGFGMRGTAWWPQLRDLARDHQLVAIDNRGVGGSEPGAGFWSMPDAAVDVLRVIDEIGWETFHLVGVSMGGMISQHVAITAPQRVLSLTLAATHAGGRWHWLPSLAGLGVIGRSLRVKGFAKLRLRAELVYPKHFLDELDEHRLQERVTEMFQSGASRLVKFRQWWAIVRHRLPDDLPSTIPVLIIRPDQDRLIHPRRSLELKRRAPSARVLTIRGAGHGVLYQHAHIVNPLLRNFIADAASPK